MLFILAILVLYVSLQAGMRSIRAYNFIVFLTSLCFSTVFTYLFAVSYIIAFKVAWPQWSIIVIVYLLALTYILYLILSKPEEKGEKGMWERIKKHLGICTIIGVIFIAVAFGFFWYSYTLYNNEQIKWSETLAVGFSFISVGIALTSLCISRTSRRILQRVVDSDYENFINLFENERISFIREAIRGGVNRFMVEVLAWKSRLYFDSAISLKKQISDKSKLREMSAYLKHLVYLLFVQSLPPQNWRPLVWNRDVGNIVKMYRRLWETGVINNAEERIKNQLLELFETHIGARRPNEDDLTLFNRILTTISERNSDITFERII